MLRAAVIGAGSRAHGLMTRIAAEAVFSVAALVEPLADRRAAAAAAFGVPLAAANLEELLARTAPGRLDCAFVVTPPWLHADAFEAVVAAGLPTFCEKPMEMDLRGADRMLRAARAARVPSMFGFNRRFTPAARLARALRGGAPPAFVHTSKSRPMTYSRMLAENSVHAVDLMLCLAASIPETVRAVAAFKDPGVEAEAFVSACVSFVGGGAGSFQMVTDGHGAVERFELYGRDFTLLGDLPGHVRYSGEAARLEEAARAAGVSLDDRGGGRFEVGGEPDLSAELAAFAALVRGQDVPPDLPGPEAAFEAQRLVEAIYRAAGLPPTRWTERWVRER